MARRPPYTASEVEALERGAYEAEARYAAGRLSGPKRDEAVADYRRAVRAMARRRQRAAVEVRSVAEQAGARVQVQAGPVADSSPATQGYFRARPELAQKIPRGAGARTRKGGPSLPSRPAPASRTALEVQRATEERRAALEALQAARDAQKASRAAARAAASAGRLEAQIQAEEQRAAQLDGRRQLQAQAKVERLYRQLDERQARASKAAQAAGEARARTVLRISVRVEEPPAVRKFRESLERQGLAPERVKAAVDKWTAAMQKQGQLLPPATGRIDVAAVANTPGSRRYAEHLDQRVAAGALTQEQRDRALAGYLEGQARYQAQVDAQKAQKAAELAALSPEQRAARERAERAEAQAKAQARRERQRERRREMERERKEKGLPPMPKSDKDKRREEQSRRYKEAMRELKRDQAGGGPSPLEGSAIRSGDRGGSFLEDGFSAASSLFTKYEQSSLYDGGYTNLVNVYVTDVSGNQLKVPDEVVKDGPEAVADWIQEQAEQGMMDPEWYELSAHGVEDDDGDVYETA